jgi:hypothetical protein
MGDTEEGKKTTRSALVGKMTGAFLLPPPLTGASGPTAEEIRGGVDLTEYLAERVAPEEVEAYITKGELDRIRKELFGPTRERDYQGFFPHKSHHTDHIHFDPVGPVGSSKGRTGKKITDVRIAWEHDTIDVTSIHDFVPQTTMGVKRALLRDQDDDFLPRDLEAKILPTFDEDGFLTQESRKVLAEWNADQGYLPDTIVGHRPSCLYQGDFRWGCTCQSQQTLTRDHVSLSWLCVCCEKPRAYKKYGPCSECEGHEDEPASTLDPLHALMDDQDGEGPAVA